MVKKLLKNLGDHETQLFEELDAYASQGLRTLTFAMRNLTSDLSAPDIDAKTVECDYQLLGITGVEDLLQDNVK